jgi:hypothetical protein
MSFLDLGYVFLGSLFLVKGLTNIITTKVRCQIKKDFDYISELYFNTNQRAKNKEENKENYDEYDEVELCVCGNAIANTPHLCIVDEEELLKEEECKLTEEQKETE